MNYQALTLLVFRGASVSTVASTTRNLVDPASSHMLVSKIKPCMFTIKSLHDESANGSLKQFYSTP